MKELFPGYFRRQDESPDQEFYRQPRLVAHIDDAAIAALGEFFRRSLPDNADVLDLMSAYLTHLPADKPVGRVVGLGMSAAEMIANVHLSSHVVQSLNDNPVLPFADAAFDAALCTVSVQYLLHPIEVFAEVCRVLRPDAPFIVSFSNRCFPTKATALWLNTGDAQHCELVKLYFERAGGWEDIQVENVSPNGKRSDPLFVVWARRKTK